MASLPKINFYKKSKTDEVLEFKSDVSVDSQGEFHVTLPDYLLEIANGVKRRDHSYAQIFLDKPAVNWRVSSSSLEQCKSFINKVMTEFLTCKVTEEMVIVYSHRSEVSYTKKTDGEIIPSAMLLEQGVEYQQLGVLHSNNRREMYSVGLSAKVFLKRTYARLSWVKVEYVRPNRPNHSRDLWMDKLNLFTTLSFDSDRQKFQQLPYTEEAAKFFYEAMISMCKLADQFDNFFGNDVLVKSAIENKQGFAQLQSKQEKHNA